MVAVLEPTETIVSQERCISEQQQRNRETLLALMRATPFEQEHRFLYVNSGYDVVKMCYVKPTRYCVNGLTLLASGMTADAIMRSEIFPEVGNALGLNQSGVNRINSLNFHLPFAESADIIEREVFGDPYYDECEPIDGEQLVLDPNWTLEKAS